MHQSLFQRCKYMFYIIPRKKCLVWVAATWVKLVFPTVRKIIGEMILGHIPLCARFAVNIFKSLINNHQIFISSHNFTNLPCYEKQVLAFFRSYSAWYCSWSVCCAWLIEYGKVAATHCLNRRCQNFRLCKKWLFSIAAVPRFYTIATNF